MKSPYQRMLAMTCDGKINVKTITEILKSPGVSEDTKQFIVRAVNSHDALLKACKYAFNNLKPKGDIKKDFSGHLAMVTLSKAVAHAERKL